MEKVELGRSGIRVSVVGLGCNNFGLFKDEAQAQECVHAALAAGITLFDMASEHGGGKEEELVGKALGARRAEVVIATKVGQEELLGIAPDGSLERSTDRRRRGLSRRWLTAAVEESLTRLGTDYIDLYQVHTIDEETEREETLGTLDELVRQGKVRAIGEAAGAATAAHVAASDDLAASRNLTRFVAVQAKYNLLHRAPEAALLPELRARGMALLPFSPLANGLLTGKYRREASFPTGSRLDKLPALVKSSPLSEASWDKIDRLRAFADERSLTLLDLAFAWLLSEPLVASVIAGATSAGQVMANARAGTARLTAEDKAELDRITAD
jgi:aryl-alcohol dehydrogenase-like predicted oxidoreductase